MSKREPENKSLPCIKPARSRQRAARGGPRTDNAMQFAQKSAILFLAASDYDKRTEFDTTNEQSSTRLSRWSWTRTTTSRTVVYEKSSPPKNRRRIIGGVLLEGQAAFRCRMHSVTSYQEEVCDAKQTTSGALAEACWPGARYFAGKSIVSPSVQDEPLAG